jgi:hypothetical protein
MKRIILSLWFAGCSLLVIAQQPGKSQSFGIGVEGGVSPNVGTTQYVNLDLTARYAILAGPGYAYLGTGFMVSREGLNFQIPIRVGYKYIFSKKYFVSEEFGYYFFKDPDSYAGQTVDHGVSLATSVGFQFSVFDVGLQYDAIINRNDFSTIGFVLGWNF